MGFIPDITYLPSNQSYNGVIDAIANDAFDMVVGDVTVYANRREKIAFSAPIFDNSVRIVTRNTPIETIDHWSFLKPFSVQLWLIILGLLVWSSFLLVLLEFQKNEALRRRALLSQFELGLVFTFGTLSTHGWDLPVRTLPGRLLMIGMFIVSFVLVAQYQANLTSDLTIAKTQNIISGFDDLKAGKIPFNRIGIRVNTAVEAFYLREISGNNRNFYPLLTKEESFEKLVNNIIDATVMDAGVAEYFVGNVYCNLTLIGAPTDYSQFAIVTQKNWLYQQTLDVTILSLRELGILDSLKNKWFQTSYCSYSSGTSDHRLSIESLAGLFIIFAVLSALSLVLFVFRMRVVIKSCLLALIKKITRWFRRECRRLNARTITQTPTSLSRLMIPPVRSVSGTISNPSFTRTPSINSTVSRTSFLGSSFH